MAGEQESERELEPVLRQVLRQPPTGTAEPCPDAGVLAAWADGTLRADEAVAFETHAAQCDRCRAMMAAFIRTDASAVLPAFNALADAERDREGVAVPFWRRWKLAFLVPVAATAMALAVYIAAPRSPSLPDTGPVAMSEFRAEPDASPLRESSGPVMAPPPSAPPVVGQATAPSSSRAETGVSPLRPDELSRSAAGNRLADASREARENTMAKVTEAPAGAPAAPEPAAASVPAAQPAAPSADAAGVAGTLAIAPAEAPPVPPRDTTSARLSAASARALSGSAPEPGVRSLGGASPTTASGVGLWRVSDRGGVSRLERSRDASTWTAITLPAGVAAADLAAVAAGTGGEIWLVGRAGLTLYAADGVSFVRGAAPAAADFTAVAATGPRAATATAADGRVYQTRDAGQTWTRR